LGTQEIDMTPSNFNQQQKILLFRDTHDRAYNKAHTASLYYVILNTDDPKLIGNMLVNYFTIAYDKYELFRVIYEDTKEDVDRLTMLRDKLVWCLKEIDEETELINLLREAFDEMME